MGEIRKRDEVFIQPKELPIPSVMPDITPAGMPPVTPEPVEPLVPA